MRARTPKKQLFGFCSQNDVVLDLSDTKRHRFGWQKFFFFKFLHTSQMISFGTTRVQNDIVWISDLVPNDVVLGMDLKKIKKAKTISFYVPEKPNNVVLA